MRVNTLLTELPHFPAQALASRLATLSQRELDWVVELLGLLGQESWQRERGNICRTVAEIVFPEEALRPARCTRPVGAGLPRPYRPGE
jgi:hypothetical protein